MEVGGWMYDGGGWVDQSPLVASPPRPTAVGIWKELAAAAGPGRKKGSLGPGLCWSLEARPAIPPTWATLGHGRGRVVFSSHPFSPVSFSQTILTSQGPDNEWTSLSQHSTAALCRLCGGPRCPPEERSPQARASCGISASVSVSVTHTHTPGLAQHRRVTLSPGMTLG